MSETALVELSGDPFERITADIAVAGFFVDELPLRGGAGRIDWRLCGSISEQILAGRMRGERKEAQLAPSMGRFRAPRLLVVGLGARREFRQPQVAATVEQAIRRCLDLGAESLVLSTLGFEPEDFPRCAESFLRGCSEALAGRSNEITIRLALPDSGHAAAGRAIDEALIRLRDAPLTFRRASASPRKPRASRSNPAPSPRSLGSG